MAFILADRVKETASAPGTGTVTLLGAASGYQSFSAGIGASNTTYYTIADQTGANWEVGYGTIGAGGTTLARTTVLASSNSGSLVNFSSGTQDVWCDYPAKKAVSLDSAGAIRAGSNPYIDFEDGNGTTVAAGRMWYGASEGNWNLGMGGGNITQQIGEELFRYGKASAAITDSPLQLVYKTGVVGGSGVITFAPAVAGITDSHNIIGCATENIALNGFGRITTYGVVNNITTNGTAYGETWADNDDIYYNPVTGGLTKTAPSAPGLKCLIGTVITAGSGGSGKFIVKLGVATYLSGLSDVQLASNTGGQLLTYNQTGGYWKNTSLSAGTAISVTPTTGGALTVTNTAPDQTVSIASGTGISATGTYPAFTVTNTGVTSAVAGTGISVSSGTGAVTVTNTAPDQTVALASGTGISVTGTYPNFTVTNTAPSSGGTVTSVTGTSPVVSSGGNTPAISMAAATGSVNGYLTSTDWTTFNNKAAPVTYTTSYIPYGQGTTTPNQSSSLTFASSTLTAPIVSASNGIVVNSNTVSASYTIPTGSSASSVGPMTVASGQSVTVPSGSRWVVL